MSPQPPPGFVLDTETTIRSSTPEPPPGFVLDERQKPQQPLMEPGGSVGRAVSDVSDRVLAMQQDLLRRDPDVDWESGVPHAGFRAAFSFMDTEKEREQFLTRRVGKEGWTRDKYGAWALTPQGQQKLGLQPKHEKPVLIDEVGVSWRDLADIASAGPPVVGATVGGATMGIPGAVAGAGVGATVSEGAEYLMGSNLQPLGEVAQDVATEAALAGAGELAMRGLLRPAGRKLMAPEAKRMTPESRALTQEARDIGAQPSVSQITKAPILGRTQSMTNRIFGDPLVEKNAAALRREMERLARSAGPETVSKKTIGETIHADIAGARHALSEWSKSATGKLADMTGGQPVVPTSALKRQAQDLLDVLPKGQSGQAVLTPGDELTSIRQIMELPDEVTIDQMQAITNRLFDAVHDEGIVPGVFGRHARKLWRAATKTYDDIADPELREAVTSFRSRYAKEIRKFDDAYVSRIMKNPDQAGRLEPETIVGTLFRKGMSSPLRRVQKVLPAETQEQIRRVAMDDVLSNVLKRTDDPLETVFDGKRLMNTLDGYGRDTLNAMFGKDLTEQLYRFGRVTQLVTQKQAMSGGLVAAHIALHPLRNVGRLVQLNVLSKFMNSPLGMKWLTEGFSAPKTRAGADALARVATMLSVLKEEETGGPAF